MPRAMQEECVRPLCALVHRHIRFQHLKMLFVPVKLIGVFSDTQSIYSHIAADHTFSNEKYMVELLYCTHHERLYDATEHRWIPFLRGEVRLVQTIHPKRGDLYVRHNICDVCIRGSQRCFGWQLERALARVPAHLLNLAVQEHET
jgi:hypothetical protein